MTDATTIAVALIAAAGAAAPGILSAYLANEARKLGVANGTTISKVAEQTDGMTKSLVAVEKKLSFKEGVAAEKERAADG